MLSASSRSPSTTSQGSGRAQARAPRPSTVATPISEATTQSRTGRLVIASPARPPPLPCRTSWRCSPTGAGAPRTPTAQSRLTARPPLIDRRALRHPSPCLPRGAVGTTSATHKPYPPRQLLSAEGQAPRLRIRSPTLEHPGPVSGQGSTPPRLHLAAAPAPLPRHSRPDPRRRPRAHPLPHPSIADPRRDEMRRQPCRRLRSAARAQPASWT